MFLYCYMETVLSTEGRPREASFGWGGMRHLRARYAIASRGGSRSKTGWAHYQDALRSETRRRQIAGDAANGAPRGAAHIGDGVRLKPVTSPAPPGQPGAPARRAIPPPLGDGKREEDGRTPAPKQSNRGQHSVGYAPFHFRTSENLNAATSTKL